ncbi:MAG: hypothetical protein ACP5HU_06310 [Phycisphaerae bacterium]
MILIVVRWCVAVAFGLGWVFALLMGVAHTLRSEDSEFTKSPFYHAGVLLGIFAVVILPLGDFLERAPYALLTVLPEIVATIDLVLSAVRDRK